MNPITENRFALFRFALIYGVFAAAYSVAFGLAAGGGFGGGLVGASGGGLPVGLMVVDGLVFWLVSGVESLMLWNVLKYGAAGTPAADLATRVGTPTAGLATQVGTPAAVLATQNLGTRAGRGAAVRSGRRLAGPLRFGTGAMIGAAGVLFVVVAVGAECLAMWLMVGILASDAVEVLGASGGLAEGVSELTMGIPEGVSGGLAAGVSGLPEFPVGFLATVPARGILCAVVYVCFVLWYWFAGRSDSEIPSEFLNQSEKFKVKSESRSADGGGLRYAEVGGAVEGAAEASAVGVPTAAAQECIERVTVRGAGGRIEVIGVGEIVYLQAEGDYVAIVTESGRWLKEGTMKAFEEVLPRDRFVRVHRSYIVAVGHISRIETSGREHVLVLRGVSARGGGSGAGLRGGGGSGGGSIRISEGGYRLLKGVLGL